MHLLFTMHVWLLHITCLSCFLTYWPIRDVLLSELARSCNTMLTATPFFNENAKYDSANLKPLNRIYAITFLTVNLVRHITAIRYMQDVVDCQKKKHENGQSVSRCPRNMAYHRNSESSVNKQNRAINLK